jgi:hypothetical protein
MTLHGKIHNGVVIFDDPANLPEGTPVTVLVAPSQPPGQTSTARTFDRMSEEQRIRLLAALDAIAALPNENPGDTFSGADHDKVLYGEP